jgi:hypothetical protein
MKISFSIVMQYCTVNLTLAVSTINQQIYDGLPSPMSVKCHMRILLWVGPLGL